MTEFRQYDMAGLIHEDLEIKGHTANAEWARLDSIYQDTDRAETIASLSDLGQGIKGNRSPVQVQLLRRIVGRRAGLYHRPPSRFLLDIKGGRIDEDAPEQKAMEAALKRAQYDLFWREVDANLALMYNAVIRLYPSTTLGSVVPRLFAPHNVHRQPSDVCPNNLACDARFALKLSGNLYEYFEQVDEGVWFSAYVDKDGVPQGPQPFPETLGVVPYALPAMILYDRYPGGRPWIQPSESRAPWHDSINAAYNDMMALVRAEAHSLKIVATDNTAQVPHESGPGTTWVLPLDATADVLSNQPKISESLEVAEALVRMQAISEDLPSSEFDKSKQIVTGAARKIEEGPLHARRDARRAMAEMDERHAYTLFVAVHNYHREDQKWEAPLDGDLFLDLEVAPMSNPVDAKEAQESNALGMEQGTRSRVDAVMAEHDCGRREAIRIIKRVDKDLKDFPAPKKPEPELLPGFPKQSDDMDMETGPQADPKE